MKHITLSRYDTERLKEGWSIAVDCYIIYNTPAGWEWAINPDEVEWYNPDTDELDEYIDYDSIETKVIDLDLEDIDEEDEEDEW